MRKLKWSAISLCLASSLLYGSAYAGDVWTDYLEVAEGDSLLAHNNMESDILLFSGEIITLEADNKKATARGDRYAAQYDEETQGWFARLWNRIKFSVGLLAGVWLGSYASK